MSDLPEIWTTSEMPEWARKLEEACQRAKDAEASGTQVTGLNPGAPFVLRTERGDVPCTFLHEDRDHPVVMVGRVPTRCMWSELYASGGDDR